METKNGNEQQGRKNEKVSVRTPAGTLVAEPGRDPDYPGIDIRLVGADGKQTLLALVEYNPGGSLCESGGMDVIPEERLAPDNRPEYAGRGWHVLTPGMVAHLYNDGNREEPVSVGYANIPGEIG